MLLTASFLQVLLALIVIGVILGLVNRYIPMAGSIKSILNGVVVIIVVIWLLQYFGVLGSLGIRAHSVKRYAYAKDREGHAKERQRCVPWRVLGDPLRSAFAAASQGVSRTSIVHTGESMRLGTLASLTVLVASTALVCSAQAQPPSHGPAKGYLLITGGATEPRDYERLVNMAGGAKARIVVIPNASVVKPTSQADLQREYCGPKSPFAAFPNVPCTVVYTNDRAVANTAAFTAPIDAATAVWFVGGRHWRIADVYLDTLTQKAFFALLDRGGTIGGGSAGATIQGSYMVRGSAQPDDNTIMMAPGHEIGLGFLSNATVDQHVDVRHRENDLAVVIKAHPTLLCLGLDQATSMTIHADTLTVNGPKRLAVWDGKDHDGKGYYYLHTGDQLNLVTRVPTLAPVSAQP